MRSIVPAVLGVLVLGWSLSCGAGGGRAAGPGGGSSTGGETNPVCAAGTSTGPVQRPLFVRNIPSGQTGEVLVDAVQVEIGAQASGWQPAHPVELAIGLAGGARLLQHGAGGAR